MKKLYSIFAMAISALALTSPFTSFSQENVTTNVELPSSSIIPIENSYNRSDWEKFETKFASPNVALDKELGTPKYIMGGKINIKNNDPITGDNVVKLVNKFIDDNSKSFGFNSTNLKLVQNDYVNGRYYLTFLQYYNGVKVLNSKVNLTVFENGNLPTIKINYYPNIEISTTASASFESAANKIGLDLKQTTGKGSEVLTSKTPCVLPVKTEYGTIYKLVYSLAKENESDPINNALYYVDAHSLETVSKRSLVNDGTSANIKGYVKKNSPFDTLSLQDFSSFKIKYEKDSVFANTNGYAEPNPSTATDVNLLITGKWCDVITKSRNRGSIVSKLIPDQNNQFIWDDKNSHRYERNVYYYYNRVKDIHQKLDTGLKCLDVKFTLQLEYMQNPNYPSPNAYSSGQLLCFVDLHDTTQRMPDVCEILYHEYGHSVNSIFYQSKGVPNFRNGAVNEGTADITAAMITGNRKCGIGYSVTNPSLFIRDLKHTLSYPGNIVNETHEDGKIIAGAYWDLGEYTSIETMGKLMHYARYQLPDDDNTGTAFFEWFVATLVADDNDGDLNNGTPHFKEIIKAFNNHGIGFQLIYPTFIYHTPITNKPVMTDNINVDFKVKIEKFAFLHVDTATISYRVRPVTGFNGVWNTVKATKLNDTNFTAPIPPQTAGCIVDYYIAVYDSLINKTTTLYLNNDKLEPFSFFVGFKNQSLNNLENANWKIGDTGDISDTIAKWVLAVPKEIKSTQFGYLRPGSDYSASGDKCYMSSNNVLANSTSYWNVYKGFPNGTVSLITDVIDVSSYYLPLIKFKYFFGVYEYAGAPTMNVYAMFDSAKTWTNIKELRPTSNWSDAFFRVKDYVVAGKGKFLKLKFTYKVNKYYNTMPVGIGCALVDDLEVLKVDDMSDVNDNMSNHTGTSINVYPNPFSESVTMELNSLYQGPATFAVYNTLGVKVFENSLNISSGNIRFNFDGIDNNGENLTPGTYFYALQLGDKTLRGKISKK